MKIELSKFAERQLNDGHIGSFSTDTKETIENNIHEVITKGLYKIEDGYAPFCKILKVKREDVKLDLFEGLLKITKDNVSSLESRYMARTEEELPVLTRFLLNPKGINLCENLTYILYSKEQCEKEDNPIESDYAIVAMMGNNGEDITPPISPITMFRNALGEKEGGSGVELDREAYLESIEFWNTHALVKIER